MTRRQADKLTPERAKKIADAIRMGATYELAAKYAGISVATLARWRKSKKHADFEGMLCEAEGAGAMGWLLKIERAANKDWRAAAWKLERRYPESYGRQIFDTRHSAPNGGPIEINAVDYRSGLEALKPEDAPEE